MLKFLLILGLVVYIVYKVGSLFFRASRQFQDPNRRHFDATRHPNDRKKNSDSNFKGGEYIDYEEVK